VRYSTEPRRSDLIESCNEFKKRFTTLKGYLDPGTTVTGYPGRKYAKFLATYEGWCVLSSWYGGYGIAIERLVTAMEGLHDLKTWEIKEIADKFEKGFDALEANIDQRMLHVVGGTNG
jgi:hypothetical protein